MNMRIKFSTDNEKGKRNIFIYKKKKNTKM